MRLKITHRTSYAYAAPIERGVELVRLFPSAHAGLSVLRWFVTAKGARVGQSFLDGVANRSALVDLNPGVESFEILVEGEVETRDSKGLVEGAAEPLPPGYFLRETRLTTPNAAIAALTPKGADQGARAIALMHAVRERIDFQVGVTDVHVDAAAALERGGGVCQDHAHVFLAAARAAGIPARYVSGYLYTGEKNEPASHAWCEAYVETGWLGLDAANRAIVNDGYVRLAVGLDYREAAPIAGVRVGGGTETLAVEVGVRAEQ
ncbi:MAG: transglutaminase domain-containing protein [Hyphomonadaceae bacterium]